MPALVLAYCGDGVAVCRRRLAAEPPAAGLATEDAGGVARARLSERAPCGGDGWAARRWARVCTIAESPVPVGSPLCFVRYSGSPLTSGDGGMPELIGVEIGECHGEATVERDSVEKTN